MTAFVIHVTFDCQDPERVATFWSAVTGYERMDFGNPDVVGLQAPDSRGVRRLLFYRVREAKTVKNRVHVDLATGDPESEIARLVELGATRGEYFEGNGARWTVMADPEGNEFCIG